MTLLLLLAGLALALVVTGLALELAGRIARYRNYRATFPAAPRGRVWRHVR